MNDPYDLRRFVAAQNGVYSSVLQELEQGAKTGHWIWYIFPQLAGLGRSQISQRYSIASFDEARAYSRHPVLGPRLVECVTTIMNVKGKSAEQIFGYPDCLKFRSCMTLFAEADCGNAIYRQALERFFAGVVDPLTVAALKTLPHEA